MTCIYCGGARAGYRAAMGIFLPRVRSPESIARDIAVLSERYNVEVVKFSHDPLLWGRKNFLRLVREIRERGVDVAAYWDAYVLPGTQEVKAALRAFEAGLCLGISLESLRDDVRWRAGRFYRREEVEKAIALYDDMGVVVDLYFLIGLPGDSVESIKKIPEYSFNIMRKHTHVTHG